METKTDLVAKLKQEADSNAAFKAVCTVFAVRERARQQVTVNSLARVMNREGFEFTKDDYKTVLARLAEFGVGRLDRAPNGRLRALKGINVKLQSIGKAAVDGGALTPFKPQVRFKELPTIVEAPKVSQKKTPKAKTIVKGIRKQAAVKVDKKTATITIGVLAGGERIQLEIPVDGLRLSK